MGRRRVELRPIENKISRQVTFAKRRNGLLKKGYELSLLCDAEVALIIFSCRGRLSEFSTSSSMYKILERYRSWNNKAHEANLAAENEVSYLKYLKLKTRVEFFESSQRNFRGEDLGLLSIKELEQIEEQIDVSLKHIRSRKDQVLRDQLSDLKSKEKELQDQNKELRKKLQDPSLGDSRVHMSSQDEGQSSSSGYAIDLNPGPLQHQEHELYMTSGYHKCGPSWTS